MESFLRSKYETEQKMNKLEQQINSKQSKKRKNRDSDDDFSFFQASKRQKVHCKPITFKITNFQQMTPGNSNKNVLRSSGKMEEDDDLGLMVPENEQCDDDAIGDDLFDMMPDVEEDWNGNDNAKTFGIVENKKDEKVNISENEKKKVNEEQSENVNVSQPEPKKLPLPLLKCATNNSSIWPNRNKEFENCEWLDSVIISDEIKPKKEMNTNLIINLNDHRMEWTEEFVKNMTKLSETAIISKDDENVNKDEEEEEDDGDDADDLKRKYSLKKWNLSNDKMYQFTDISLAQKRNLHTPMAYTLNKEIFPQKQNVDDWVNLHRKPIKLTAESIKICISSKSAKYCSKERMADIQNKYSMYIPKDWRELSAANDSDRIVLLEYLEEYPLIIQSVGMSSNITTLYRKSSAEYDANIGAPQISVDDGTVKILNPNEKSCLLGAPRQTKHVTVLENKLYVAPIRSHTKTLNVPSSNLFLLVGNGHTYYIRKVNAVFAVGQIQPKKENLSSGIEEISILYA